MSNIKLLISITLILTILVACSSSSSAYSKKISSDNKPLHHTNKGYQNHPFVETAAPKGIFFYMRRAWDSVFVSDVPDGHELTELESLQLLNSISSDRVIPITLIL